MRKSLIVSAAAASFLAAAGTASAGGLIADVFIKSFSPDLAKAADDAHDRIKKANPDYGKAEEKMTNDFRESIGLQPHCEPLYNKYGEQVACQ